MNFKIGIILLVSILGSQFVYSNDVRDLDEIISSGIVKVGLRKSPTVYMENEETGKADGYVWSLVLAWADSVGVEAIPVYIDTMPDYWEYNGEISPNLVSDESISYTPDIYSKIDIAADIFTLLPWRERLVDMHQYLEAGSILVVRKEDNITRPQDLIGKRVYVVKGQSGYNLILEYLNKKSLNFKEITVNYSLDNDGLSVLDYSGNDGQISDSVVNLIAPVRSARTFKFKPLAFYQWLLNNQVDLLINNSLTFFIYNEQNNSMRRYLEPVLPLSDNLITLCLASSKETPELSKSLHEFLDNSQINGLNDRLLKKYAGIGLNEYNELIGKE